MSSSRRTARPHKREGFWYLVRRVPAQYAALDKRGIVPDGLKKSQWAVETAGRYGFPYVELADLNIGPLLDLVKRLLAVEPLSPEQREKVLPALWGHHPKPVDGTLLSEMTEIYETIHAASLCANRTSSATA